MSESRNATKYSVSRKEALAGTVTAVKASPGIWHGGSIVNNASLGADAYLYLYDAAAADVTYGTTAAKVIIPLKNGLQYDWELTGGVKFTTAISMASADIFDSEGSPSGSDLDVSILYV